MQIFSCNFLHSVQLGDAQIISKFQIFLCNFLHSVQLGDAQIILKFQINKTNSVSNTIAQSCDFFVHHISKTAVASLIFFLFHPNFI
ncbi:hypothetical protein O3M35_012614 [Rhynocoris fuscipes]|uniref:Uncharacterized protein n=1 Tax=Rhynocoris fuscipes TaxID=488301 RepID=A0AAW1CWU6_9HEMI